MPNIYLRTSAYVCAYFRNRDNKHPLAPNKPILFMDYTLESEIMRAGLNIIPEEAQVRAHCFSQFAWRNMMHGKTPDGSVKVLRRDSDEWLSNAEVYTILGQKRRANEENFDYLCIQMPREIMINSRLCRTNNTYSLDRSCAVRLNDLLRREFKETFQDWIIQDRRYCNHLGVARTRVESIERFLMTFDIPVSTDQKERESLRRMTNRWLDKSRMLVNDRLQFADGFFRHLTDAELTQLLEHEQERTEKRKKRF